MALTSAQLVQQMYIAYYQRPAEPGGVQYWVGKLEEAGGKWQAIANDFGNPGNTEYAALYGDKTREELVAELYKSAFGREADAGEIDYWANHEDAQQHSDQQLGFAIISGAQGNDKVTIDNKIKFSELLAAELGSDEAYDELVANANVAELLAAVTAETEVNAEYVAGVVAGAAGTPTPTEGLNAYVEAAEAETAALETLARALGSLEEDASQAAVSTAMNNTAGSSRDQMLASARADVVTEEKAVQAATASLALARSVTSDAELSAAVTAAQRNVNNNATARDLQTELQEAESDVAAHAAANGSNQAVATALYEAVIAFGQAGGTTTNFNTFVADYQAELLKPASAQNFAPVLDPVAVLVNVDANGNATLVDPLIGATAALRTAVSDAAKVAGVRDQLNDAAATADTAFTSNTLGQALVNAQKDVADRQDLVDDVADAQADFADAQADLAGLTALVGTYFNAREATGEALEALADDYGIEDLVEVTTGSSLGVANTDELFLFSQSDDFNSAVISFETGDQLYVGDKFSFGGNDPKAGDNGVLEVFFVQRGGNVEVRLEETAFGSNAATPEVDVITLVGVNAGQLSFNEGFISVDDIA